MTIKVCRGIVANSCLCICQKPEYTFFPVHKHLRKEFWPWHAWEKSNAWRTLSSRNGEVFSWFQKANQAKTLKNVILNVKNQNISLMFWKTHTFQVTYLQPNTEAIFLNLPRKTYWSQQEFCSVICRICF